MFGFGQDAKYQPEAPPVPEEQGPGVIISPDTRRENRIPPGQSHTRKWPVLDASGPPRIDLEIWRLSLDGLVEDPIEWSWEEFQKLPRVKVFADMHCVTRWSRLGNVWEGVSTREVAQRAKVKPEAKYVVLHAYDRAYGRDWSTNLPLEAFLSEDALFADTHDGEPIDLEHGGPLRVVVPQLYAWKSAKWVKGVTFVEEDRPGFWEAGGYHMVGDPWKEQRFREW